MAHLFCFPQEHQNLGVTSYLADSEGNLSLVFMSLDVITIKPQHHHQHPHGILHETFIPSPKPAWLHVIKNQILGLHLKVFYILAPTYLSSHFSRIHM